MGFYDGTKLLSMTDINGERPEIYMTVGNRAAGKTVYYSRLCTNGFKKRGEEFLLLYRFVNELDNVAHSFFDDIRALFFPDDVMSSKKIGKGAIHELFLNGLHCGYAVALNGADEIRRNRALFKNIRRMFFDEFQSESMHYCPNEIIKFQSIHTTCSSGRYLPVYMCSNAVSLINPYFFAMGIGSRIQKNTKFLRGDGFVLEQTFNEDAADKILKSGFTRAFGASKYTAYSTQNVYLNDDSTFIEKPAGSSEYIATILYDGKNYGVRRYDDFLYCDTKADTSFYKKIAVLPSDLCPDYVSLKADLSFVSLCQHFFHTGRFRFRDLSAKKAIFYIVGVSSTF